MLFSSESRKGLVQFYQIGFNFSLPKALLYSFYNFNQFGQILIDRFAFKTFRKKQFTHEVVNEHELIQILENGKGGLLFSGHLGNWENAGDMIGERVTANINILMLDAEVQKIKQLIEESSETNVRYRLIPLKNDLTHLIAIHKALSNNELVALHADRLLEGNKMFKLPFLNGEAEFPAGPFILAHKFKVPLNFVYGMKNGKRHYKLYASENVTNFGSPEEIAKVYVKDLEKLVKKYPTQWFNFYKFYAD